MTDLATCKQCGGSMRAKGGNGMNRVFCSSRCNGDYRRGINARKRADQEARAERALAHNIRLVDRYMAERRARLARAERMAA